MNELSIFSGAGGGLLGTKLLGWRAVGYVERDAYCQAVLSARIRDGFLDPAPIFGDIRAFLRDGWADRYRGLVDVVTAGFPCQPFSLAGKRKAHDDERNLWPETADVLRRVRPRFALLENVPGLAAHPYFGTVLGDLAALGFDAEWTVLGADDCGAPHRRKRLWILAHRAGDGRLEGRTESEGLEGRPDAPERCVADTAQLSEREPDHAECSKPRERTREDARGGGRLENLAHARRMGERADEQEPFCWSSGAPDVGAGGQVADANGGGQLRSGIKERRWIQGPSGDEPHGCGAGRRREGTWRSGQEGEDGLRQGGRGVPRGSDSDWWGLDPAEVGPESESFVGRVAHGVAYRVDRLRALGNGQVPAVVVRAWRELYARL